MLRARKPIAWGRQWPVRVFLLGPTSQAAFRLLLEALNGLQSFFVSAGFADFATGRFFRHSAAFPFWPKAS